MLNLKPDHEDERRALYSFPEAKVLEVKEDCVLGKHYHKKKTEVFILTKGECWLKKQYMKSDNPKSSFNNDLEIGELIVINPFTYHEFHIKAGSVLVGLNSLPFTGDDDFTL